MLRATPNLNVFRPADIVETAECWELALDAPEPAERARPVAPEPADAAHHAFRRQSLRARGLPHARDRRQRATSRSSPPDRRSRSLARQPTCCAAATASRAAVVSMPCWELFEEQDEAYRDEVLGSAPRVAVEAAARLGWDRWIGKPGAFVGMTGFGASAPAADLYRHFGITRRGRRRRRSRRSPEGLNHAPEDRNGRSRTGDSQRGDRLTWPGSRFANCSTMPPNAATACLPSTSTTWSRASPSWKPPGPATRPSSSRRAAGARLYANDIMLSRMMDALVEIYPEIPLCIHQDHGNDEATCLTAIRHGFTSVMMDGSLLADGKTPASYDYNVGITAARRRDGACRRRLGRRRAGRSRVAGERPRRSRGRAWR